MWSFAGRVGTSCGLGVGAAPLEGLELVMASARPSLPLRTSRCKAISVKRDSAWVGGGEVGKELETRQYQTVVQGSCYLAA